MQQAEGEGGSLVGSWWDVVVDSSYGIILPYHTSFSPGIQTCLLYYNYCLHYSTHRHFCLKLVPSPVRAKSIAVPQESPSRPNGGLLTAGCSLAWKLFACRRNNSLVILSLFSDCVVVNGHVLIPIAGIPPLKTFTVSNPILGLQWHNGYGSSGFLLF